MEFYSTVPNIVSFITTRYWMVTLTTWTAKESIYGIQPIIHCSITLSAKTETTPIAMELYLPVLAITGFLTALLDSMAATTKASESVLSILVVMTYSITGYETTMTESGYPILTTIASFTTVFTTTVNTLNFRRVERE